MGRRSRIGATALRSSRRTIRVRLTLLYGSLFLLSGAGLLAITDFLFRQATSEVVQSGDVAGGPLPDGSAGPPPPAPRSLSSTTSSEFVMRQHSLDLNQLFIQSGIALLVMAFVALALGWFVAGRVLRPLRTITKAAQDISASNLHERLALAGPADELKELGDTFDGLLGRLESAFQAQKQFVANASHELRTPLARQRTLIQVALADPEASVASLKAAHERALSANRHQDRLIEALLALARSERGVERREPFDLGAVANAVVLARTAEAEENGVRLNTSLGPAPATGDPRLVERLVVNLVDNALRYNKPGGQVEIATEHHGGHAKLTIANTGPAVQPEDVDRLFQPFQRLAADRTHRDGGLGLGLSIVRAVAEAHGATLETSPNFGGGLRISVMFPAVA